jgi:hypothetical protein
VSHLLCSLFKRVEGRHEKDQSNENYSRSYLPVHMGGGLTEFVSKTGSHMNEHV